MPKLLENRTEQYINSLLPPRDALLREMERYAVKHQVPIVGPGCAGVLYQLARAIKARRVFELGSAIGYSTLWFARAVGPKGRVFYTDTDPANAKRAEDYLRRAGVLDRVRFLIGDALEMFNATPGEFDIVFNDVNKSQYPEVLRIAPPRVRAGGIFVTDNVLWYGRAARPAARGDADTRAVQSFNRKLRGSKGFFTTIIPLRDGLAVALKSE